MQDITVTHNFHGNEIPMVSRNGEPYVAMRPIVEGMGLAWQRQSAKLQEQAEKFSCNHMVTTGKDGKQYKMLCIPLKKLNGWLFSVNSAKCASEIQVTVVKYQEECFEALYDYWFKGVAVNSRKAPGLQPLNVQTFRSAIDMFAVYNDRKMNALQVTVDKVKVKLDDFVKTAALYPPTAWHPFYDHCVFGKGRFITKADLYQAYQAWGYAADQTTMMANSVFFKFLYASGYPVRPGYLFANNKRVPVIHGMAIIEDEKGDRNNG